MRFIELRLDCRINQLQLETCLQKGHRVASIDLATAHVCNLFRLLSPMSKTALEVARLQRERGGGTEREGEREIEREREREREGEGESERGRDREREREI